MTYSPQKCSQKNRQQAKEHLKRKARFVQMREQLVGVIGTAASNTRL